MLRRTFLSAPAALLPAAASRRVFVVPNFHPASCGWLTNFSMERVYCANTYFDHLDRVRDDPKYSFVLSECNNIIAMLNFRPERAEELRAAIRSGRVELVNAFFLESTINLSGGEALVRLGIEGLRWQRDVMKAKPRFAWCIDVCGTHPQMAQITAGLGLEALVYCRGNTTKSALHWMEAADGTRVLAISPGHYSDLGKIFAVTEKLQPAEMADLKKLLAAREAITPKGAPVLALGGNGDYNLAPRRKDYPSEFLKEWPKVDPTTEFEFTTLSKYLDAVKPELAQGNMQLPIMRGGTGFFFNSFWIQNPRVKTAYRRCEHQLQAAEMLSAAASLRTKFPYPSQALYESWLQMFLNMDRNTLWGAAGGMVFAHETSWDAADRFLHVERATQKVLNAAGNALAGSGHKVALWNACNWKRRDPVVVNVSDLPAGIPAEAIGGGKAICRLEAEPVALWVGARVASEPAAGAAVSLSGEIETTHYRARLDAQTGALASLRVKPSGREVLGGAANTLVAERPIKQQGDPGDHMLPRAERRTLGGIQGPVRVSATRGAVATTVVAESTFFGGGACRRLMRFYHDSPRIDFETVLNDVPDRTVVVAEFPLAAEVTEVRRGIPYGFTHSAWPEPTEALPGWNKGITPAVRWSHYTLQAGGGLAILDRGLSGRELTGRTPILFLLNTTDKYYGYPNAWLSGRGEHVLEYALLAHDSDWVTARVPQTAWEYNSPLYTMPASGIRRMEWLQTSDNVIVESMRRDGEQLEIRMAECYGVAGRAQVSVRLPHDDAALTNLIGEERTPLVGGSPYSFAVRPQQIVTLRMRTRQAAPRHKPLLEWDALVPEPKRATLRRYSNEKGHPPRGV
ncbi:MAG: hypothetical protein HY820_30230 [Acidobacteria bacterium]|nr:hypothetical protein [Acidobacteriota bacterium]